MRITQETSFFEKLVSCVILTDENYTRNKLFKKAVNLMADERLEEASSIFEQVLRIEPQDVESLLRLGYSRFHLDDFTESLRVYDKILEIDVVNAEAWNLKSLVHYEQKNYSKALNCVEKAVESDPTYGMAWYNKACFLSLLNQVPESIEALKRAIEIDVKHAKKAVRDKDFANVRAEEGFRRIIEVVVLESVRQGYHTIGSIVWTTFISKADVEESLRNLLEKGLIEKHKKTQGFHKIDNYDLIPEIAKKVGVTKKGFLGTKKQIPGTIKDLKELGNAIQSVKSSVEEEDVEKTIKNFDSFIDPSKCGQQMIDEFFEEHREIRLYKIRLQDKGLEYMIDNKQKILNIFDNIEAIVTRKLRNEVAQQ